ncbi:MAG: exosortase/archaeosortase family protein, partial [Nitrososphaerota archaeon]|nr:exosortase/archaeosortase family protein [Nitrososphaerota archaeon]
MQETGVSTMLSMLNRPLVAVTLKVSIIVIAVIALYFQDLSILFRGILINESTFHIIAVPFVLVFLVYRKRKMVGATLQLPENDKNTFQKYANFIIGIALCTVAVVAYWYGSYSFVPLEFHMVTLPFLVAGLVLVLFNVQTLKHLIFPIAFLIFLTPPPSELLFGIGAALANFSAIVSNALVNVFGIHATLSSDNVGPVISILRPDSTLIPFSISVDCSGIYSLIGFTMFAIFIAYITAGKLRNKLFIFAIGMPVMILLNITRITIILAIGYSFGETLALELFHSIGATALMFISTFILLVIREKIFKKPPHIAPCPACTTTLKNQEAQYCYTCGKVFKYPKTKLTRSDTTKIISITIAIIILLSIQAPTFALTRGPTEVLTQTPQGLQIINHNNMLPNIEGYNLYYAYRDTNYEQISGNDVSIVYVYVPDTASKFSIWVAIQIGASSTMQHRWETCLINFPLSQGNPSRVTQFALRDISLQDNPPMSGRSFAFQYAESKLVQNVLYWYQTATFDVDGALQKKNVMISLISYVANEDMAKDAENQQIPVAKAINDYWQPLRTWSTITLMVSQNGLPLLTGVIILFILLILYTVYLDINEKNSLLGLYHKLSVQDQLLIKAINDVGNNSTEAIVVEYQKLS